MKVCLQPPPTFNPCLLSSSRKTTQQFGLHPPRSFLCTHTLFGSVCFTYMGMMSTLQYAHVTKKQTQWGSDLNPKFSILSLQL